MHCQDRFIDDTATPPLRRGRSLLGTRADWRLVRPSPVLRPSPGRGWIGPIIVLTTTFATWPAFAGTVGEEGNAGFALWIGSVSIMSMAWSFVLASRLRVGPLALESWFGGLDRMYRVHRWAGAAAVAAMWLHVQNVDDVKGIAGASRRVAKQAEDLAGLAEKMLYVAVALSVVRLVPYRWWRWTHKLLGIPFAFASFHFFTATKPFANTSGWGWYFDVAMLVGLAAWLARVAIADPLLRGRRYRITGIERVGGCTDLRLAPIGRPIPHRPGQFAFIRLGGGEPHPFSIASPPGDELRFVVRDLGDWTDRLSERAGVGDTVRVDGPHGGFRPLPRRPVPTVWVAGGVGITPFLAAIEPASALGVVPDLYYAVRHAEQAPAIEELRAAHAAGRIRLHLFASSEGTRLGVGDLDVAAGAHVALCGPSSLVRTMAAAARRSGARHVEHEEFDIRSGIGPDLSRELAALTANSRS
jgi:predicted ferric reductase